jgi:predicted amino acid-binding ACT domain protein
MAILSLVGKHMCNMIGIAGRMFTTLAQGKVNIEMISQGASEINISCVIDAKDAVKALNLIHQSCLQPPETFSTAKSSTSSSVPSFSRLTLRSSRWAVAVLDEHPQNVAAHKAAPADPTRHKFGN